jgi:DNA-binding CsgD family transcriptional regulator
VETATSTLAPMDVTRSTALFGRHGERRRLDALLAGARAGTSGVLVIRGEAGVGKTALLDELERGADGFRTARAVGLESEMELAFAGLHQLCAPTLEHLDALPGPQRDALATAFGLSRREPPDRFMVGLAVLSLLSEAAEGLPLLCVVDDAQWLDDVSAQTLAFVARRLLAEPIALVFAVREPHVVDALAGLPELVLGGLDEQAARELLTAAVPGPVDEQVRDRIIADTGGNPLALLELPRSLSLAELAFGFAATDVMPLTERIEEGFRRRIDALAPDTRRVMLLAAAEHGSDGTLIWRSMDRLGIPQDAVVAATATGLIDFAPPVRFRHPLVRSAVYHSATDDQRLEVHRTLAAVTDPAVDPDRRAWHRARAAASVDEEVAGELERSADRAQARGGMAAAAAFLEESVRLTADPDHRAERALAAAHAKHEAGAPQAALSLLALAQAGPADELRAARVDRLRAQIASATRRGDDAPTLLLSAARRLEPLDPDLARDTYLEAFTAAVIAGRLSHPVGIEEVARAARAAPPAVAAPAAAEHLLDGLALLVTEGRKTAAPVLSAAVAGFCDEARAGRPVDLRWAWLAGRVAQDQWDDDSWTELCNAHVRMARGTGALAGLSIALRSQIISKSLRGELDEAAALVGEAEAANAATGTRLSSLGQVILACLRGEEADGRALVAETLSDVTSRGEGNGLSISHYCAALLNNGLRRYDEALEHAQIAAAYDDLGTIVWGLTESIEAAARVDRRDVAAAKVAQLTESTRATSTDWGLGIEARCRALISDGDAADALYREAIERLGRTRMRLDLARAHLLYGEWLRRERRRGDAREHLRTAHVMLEAMGVPAFAARARLELEATGETTRRRVVETRDELTAQEAQIARLAADGLSNPEIGAQLFISPRTVKYHLHKVFAKLGIGSRHELAGALAVDAPDASRRARRGARGRS